MWFSSDDIARAKSRIRLSQVIGQQIKLERCNRDHFGRCPFHEEDTPSFSVNDGKGFYHCFACKAHGDVIDWFIKVEKLTFAQAIERLQRLAGNVIAREDAPAIKMPNAEERHNRDQAKAIWRESMALAGTIGETYLRQARAISIDLPDDLHFHAGLPVNREGDRWPALVAAVRTIDGDLLAIQRTFLARDGSSKAVIKNPKRALGPLDNGAVHLGEPRATLGVAEGIETGLSAQEIYGLPVWCSLGSNLARIALPEIVRNLIIFADRGDVGEEAATKAAMLFRTQGRRIAVRFAARGAKDFNDELKGRRKR